MVGDRRPLERNLARFLLEERGFSVAVEAATAADTARAVREHRPEVVLVHEDVAAEDASLIEGIRSASPHTRVVVLTTDRAAASPALVAAADAVVEEGSGLKELVPALAGRRTRQPAARQSAPVAFAAAVRRPPATPRERGWIERVQGAAAASIIVLAVVLARSTGTDLPTPPSESLGRVHLLAAEEALDTLQERLEADATLEEVAILARDLLEERSSAWALGADTEELDAAILELIGPMLEDVSSDVAEVLVQLLGELVTGEEPAEDFPSPAPSPVTPRPDASPEPGPDPKPSPDTSPQPDPVTSP
ncbi:MAG: hypothetical protein ACXWX9_08050, partial [Actinomycetota bacterium]